MFCLHVLMYYVHTLPIATKGSDPLELEFQTVVSIHVDAEN